LLASAFLQYTTTAIAMPWEVGKVLLQVQWVPKRIEDAPIPDFDLELELELEEEDDNDELVGKSGTLEVVMLIFFPLNLIRVNPQPMTLIFTTLPPQRARRVRHVQGLF
jgi:hypothetical protein